MTNLIFDLSRVDDYVTRFLVSKSQDDRRTESIRMYQGVFALHGTNREDFEKSLKYYQEHPQSLRPVFDSLKVMENNPFRSEQTEPVDTVIKQKDSLPTGPEGRFKQMLNSDTALRERRDSVLKEPGSKTRIPRITVQ